MHSMYYFQTWLRLPCNGLIIHLSLILLSTCSFTNSHIKLKGKQQPTRRKIRERAFTSFAD